MKIQKILALFASAAVAASMAAVPVSAEEDGTVTEVISPKWDMQLRKDNDTYQPDTDTLEINGKSNMYGGLYFEIPKKDGKILTSATLKIVSERNKSTSLEYAFYAMNTDTWHTEGTEKVTYSKLSNDITEATAKTPLAKYIPAGEYNKSFVHDTISSDYADVSKWTNIIELPVTAITPGLDFALLCGPTEGNTTQTKFYTKDVTDNVPLKDGVTVFYAEDLKPTLTLVYSEPAAKIGDTPYLTLDEALADISDKGLTEAEITLLKDQTLSARVLLGSSSSNGGYPNLKNLTITGTNTGETKPTITAPNNALAFEACEVSEPGTSITLKNVAIVPAPTSQTQPAVSLKNRGKLTAENAEITNLDIAGNTTTAVNNSIITNLKLSSPEAKLTLGSNNTVSGNLTFGSQSYTADSYTLIAQTGNNTLTGLSCTAPEGYTYSNGVLTKTPAAPVITAKVEQVIPVYGKNADGSENTDEKATAVVTSITSDTDNTAFDLAKCRWTVGTDKYKIDTDKSTEITVHKNTSVTFGIIIDDIYTTQVTADIVE